jgi:O-antigen ligase
MFRDKLGLVLCVIYFVVSFSQFHIMIPGLKYLKLGLISSVILFVLIIPYLAKAEWFSPLGKYRILFLLSLLPGLIWGFSTGKTLGLLIVALQDFIAGFIGICMFVKSTDKLQVFNKILICTALFISIFVLTHGGHGPGLLFDENDVGLVLTMLCPFAYFTIATNIKRLWKIIMGLLLVLVLAAIASTLSRGAMVGILPILFIIWLKSKNKIISLLFIVVTVLLVVFLGPPQLINEFRSIQDTKGNTAGERRYFWDLSTELFKKKPIFGVGAGGWNTAIWSGLIYLPRGVRNQTPHSTYFQLLSELGIFGVISWSLLILTTFKTSLNIKKIVQSIKSQCNEMEILKMAIFLETFSMSLAIGLVGGMICGLFLSFLFYPYIYFYITLMQVSFVITKNLFFRLQSTTLNN